MTFIARLAGGERMTDLCREFGISRKTGYKIKKEGRKEGRVLPQRTQRAQRKTEERRRKPSTPHAFGSRGGAPCLRVQGRSPHVFGSRGGAPMSSGPGAEPLVGLSEAKVGAKPHSSERSS
ncbi:MAG: hypothetical protein ACYS22_07575 [Planctomycetota bacterium]